MLDDLLANASKFSSQITDVKKRMQEQIVEGVSGAGAVKVTMNGLHEVHRVEIDPESMDDKNVLEDLIAAAINDANRRVVARCTDFLGKGMPSDGMPNLSDLFK